MSVTPTKIKGFGLIISLQVSCVCYPMSFPSYISIIAHVAGVLVGAWPCGIIIMISELFQAESNSQVHGSLHQYFSDDPLVLDKLGTYNYVYVYSYKCCGCNFCTVGYACSISEVLTIL